MRKTTRILSIVLVLLMLVGLMPATAFADDSPWARVTYSNGDTVDCATFPEAWNKATASNVNNATVTLFNNWDGGRFTVPEGKTVTLELNGWVLTRNMSSGESKGEVLRVEKGGRLNVYGGTKSNPAANAEHEHSVWVYRARGDRYAYTRDKITLKGGIINGGHSTNGGGGIHMEESAKVYLYHVTVAGNRADESSSTDGDGGGVKMNGDNGYLYMEDTQIIYNCARYDGGGIMAYGDYCSVKMVRSRIDHNVADDNGGGIYVQGNGFSLRGDAKQTMDPLTYVDTYKIKDWTGAWDYLPPVDKIGSSVSYNCVFNSEDGGGALYMDNEGGLIEGINFLGNIATHKSDSGDGGAIYLDQEDITIKNCNILRNKADKLGGGIYVRGDDNIVDYDDNTVDSCTIWWNVARAENGAGGGIYIYKYCDLNISGTLIVRENVSKTYSNDNIYLSTDGAAVNAYVVPDLKLGADVHIRRSWYGGDHDDQISRDGGTYDESMFTYDNNTSHYIKWMNEDSSASNYRKLWVVVGSKPSKPEPVVFTPESGKRTQTVEGGYAAPDGENYELIKGIVSYPKYTDDYADLESVFYYSDGFFAGNTNTYNPQLATASMCLAGAAGYSNEYGKDDYSGGMSSDYLDKSQNFRQFVSDIGCKDEDIYVNDFNVVKPDADTIGVGIASKPIFDTKTLVIIGVRGMGYEKEWISNLTLGASGEAAGWSSAATQVMAALDAYLTRKGIDGTSENTIFWIAGYSRAGATSNLTAKRIVDKYDNAGTHTFAYPLEAPMGGVASAKVAGNNYNCIHNVVNQNDIVPWTGTTEMGFIRYGVDHYNPGSTSISANPSDGDDNNKVPEDNSAWDVSTDTDSGYYKQRKKMLSQLSAINSDIIFDDYFHRATVRYVTGTFFETTPLIYETSDHGDEMPDTEGFVKFFFEKLQEWAFKYDTSGNTVSGYTARTYFANYNVKNSTSFQQAAGSTFGLIFGMSSESSSGLIECLKGIKQSDYMETIYHDLKESGIKNLSGDLDKVWGFLKNPSDKDMAKGARKLSDFLTEGQISELGNNFTSLAFPLLAFVAMDYTKYGQDIVGTAAYNIPRIIANHYPEVTHSWLRSYDYLYANDGGAPTVMDPAVKTGPSGVTLKITHQDGTEDTLILNGNQSVEVSRLDKLSLILTDADHIDTGEAIYYQFTAGTDRKTHAYSQPISVRDIIDPNGGTTAYGLIVTSAHNGTKLPLSRVTFTIPGRATLSYPTSYENGAFRYTQKDFNIGGGIERNVPSPGDSLQFARWDVYLYNNGTVGEAISPEHYIEYFGTGFDAKNPRLNIRNMMGVSARFVPVFKKSANTLTFNLGDYYYKLPPVFTCTDNEDEALATNRPIYWSWDEATNRYLGEFQLTLTENVTLTDAEHLIIEFDPALENADPPYYISNPEVRSLEMIGSEAILVIAFEPTTEQGADGGYIDGYVGTLTAYDLNTEEVITVYRVNSNPYGYSFEPVTDPFPAPVIKDMEFVRWWNGSTDPELPHSDVNVLNMSAYYRPVVNTVEITLSGAPASGEVMPTLNSATVTIENTWRIDTAALSWTPDDATANHDTVYTARITANKAELAGTNLNDPDSGSIPLAGAFAFAEDLAVIVKDEEGYEITITNYVFTETEDDVILDLVFEQTEKQIITGFADVGVNVAHGSSKSQILAALPTEVYAYLDNGMMVSVPVAWDDADDADPYDLEALTVTAYGSYVGSDYTVAEGVALTATVTVNEADRTGTPVAVPGAGKYMNLVTVALTADEGAAIRYAVRTFDASEYYTETTDPETGNPIITPNPDLDMTPPDAEDYLEYDEPIGLDQYGKVYLLYAYAEKEGMNDSIVAAFRYELTKPEVMKLEAKDPKIAEDGNIECWYSYKTKDDEIIPEKYYADEDCTELLDYSEDVRIPAFISTFHPADETDAVAECVKLYEEEQVVFSGLDTLGVQEIGSDGQAARVLTVLDARIIRDATDYGYLFTASDAEPTYDAAQYKYSCTDTANTLYGGEDYCYVTAKIAGSFLDEDLKVCFYVKLENGTDYIYSDAVACMPTITGTGMPDNVEDNITLDINVPKFKSHSLVLSGKIGVNFFMDLPAIDGVDYADSYMTFEISGAGEVSSDPVPFDPTQTNASGVLYGFTCYVTSIQMADTITATFHYGDELTVSETYSIKQYIESFDTYIAEYPGLFNEETINLVHALADYGHYVQLFLESVKGWTLGTDDDQYAPMELCYQEDYDVEAVAEAVADCGIVRDNNSADIQKITYSVRLDSDTAILVYFKPVKNYSGSFTVTLDGETYTATKQSDGRYLVEIPNIGAHLLGTTYTIVATTDAGSATVEVSVLSYVKSMLDTYAGNTNAENAACAICYYNVAAQAYIALQQ